MQPNVPHRSLRSRLTARLSESGRSESRRPVSRRSVNRRSVIELCEERRVLASAPQLIELHSSGDANPSDFVQLGNLAYFAAESAATGRELWQTDGTTAGTKLVKDIRTGTASSGPLELTVFNNALYFIADDGENGQELWKSDGTAAGTIMLKDIYPGQGTQAPFGSGPFRSLPQELTVVGNLLYFTAIDATNGRELWKSDGTASGTVLVKDIFSGSSGSTPQSSSPANLLNVNGTLFFTANDGVAGIELWKSDGTSAGTVMVTDLFTGTTGSTPNSSEPAQLQALAGTVYFSAQDATNGRELWKSNGTASGTVLVKNVRSGSDSGLTTTDPLMVANGTLFFSADDGTSGRELWKSNGTEAGTVRVKDILAGAAGSITSGGWAVLGSTLYFPANDGAVGTELWKSDGTEAGTVLVRDVDSAATSSQPQDLTAVAGRLFFSAVTGTGREVWESDGTSAGTKAVADLLVGSGSSNPTGFAPLGGMVLFSAADATAGRELRVAEVDNRITARIKIVIDGQELTIPNNIGVATGGTRLSQVNSIDANGNLRIEPVGTEALTQFTLGDFFTTWRTQGGQAGNNAAADLNSKKLMASTATLTKTVKMFVNGQVSTEFEKYALRDNDQVVLVYGANPVVSINTNFGPIVMELFLDQKPITVGNFLNYVNDGDYLNSFFHRSAKKANNSGFVVQGGGFRTNSTTFTNVSQFTSVPADAQITNEPGISNLRGTVAMAKLGGQPNSATNQWFVNLNDNSSELNNQNGGFTVFGEVIDMATVDAIAALPVNTANGAPYNELPVSASSQLAVMQSVAGLGRIRGTKYRDSNANSNKDTGETGIANATVYVDANSNNLLDVGELSTTTDANGDYMFELKPGVYSIRTITATGDAITEPLGASKSYSVTVEIGEEATGRDFGEIPLAAPTSVDLVAATDTGTSDSDNLTNRNNSGTDKTLQFLVSGVSSGSEVRIFVDSIQIGSAIASGSTVTVTTNGTDVLPAGLREIRAVQVQGGSASGTSPALNITIDTTAPAAITNTAPNTATVNTVYTFDANSPDEDAVGVVYSLATPPSGMTINADGVVSWTPTAAQAVPQNFQIRLTDAAGNAAVQNVALTVLSALPALPDTYNATEDTPLVIAAANGILVNDGGTNPGTLTAAVVQTTTRGTLQLNANGTFTYTPSANFFGSDTFTYKANNGTQDSNVALVTIQVAGVNDPTVTTADTYSATEDTTLTVALANGVLANDSDPDNATLTVAVATQPTHGTLTLNPNGTFTYTPTAQYNGPDSFTYTVNDGSTTSNAVQVTINVAAVNDAPSGTVDAFPVNEDAVLTVSAANGLLKNDTDPDGTTTLTAKIQAAATNGTVVLNNDGSFTYTPNANFAGTDAFTYRVSDGTLDSAPITVTLTVVEQPDAPVVNDDTFQVTTAGLLLNALQNDTANNGSDNTLTITSFTQGANGTITLENNQLKYVPRSGFAGTDTFTYVARNAAGLTDTASVTVTVTNTGSNRITGYVYLDSDKSKSRSGSEQGVPGALITLSGTDTSGATLSRTTLTGNDGSYRFDDVPAGTYQVAQRQPSALSDGSESTAVANAVAGEDKITNLVVTGANVYADNNFGESTLRPTFVTIAWFFASAAQPTQMLRRMIAVSEEKAGEATLAQQIRAGETTSTVNTAPIANADNYSVAQGGTLTTTVSNGLLANDTDAEGNALVATVVTNPTNGTLTLSSNGTFTYKPSATFSGVDTFTYTASDGLLTSAARTVTITVGTTSASFTVAENSPAARAVGTLSAPSTVTLPVLFDFQNATINNALKLAADDHITGNAANPVVLIQYLDLQSGDDASFHTMVKSLETQFSTQLLVVRRFFPLTTNANALAAARAAEAAGRQGSFDAMVNLLYTNQDAWEGVSSPQTLFNSYAQQLGLNITQFTQDLADASLQARIQRDIDAGKQLGLTTTPAFYLNGTKITIPANEAAFKDLIQAQVTAFNQPFRLDRRTGAITVSGAVPLNFESKSTYPLVIDVTGANRQTATLNTTVTLTNVNEKPVGVVDTYTINQGAVLTVDVASGVVNNDTDPDGDSLTAVLGTTTANGQLTLNANGSFSYTPRANFSGTDTFTYRAKDASLESDAVTVTLQVTDVNLAPVAVANTYTATEDTTLTVTAAQGLLANDTDGDGDTLRAELVTSVSKGQLVLNQDGGFTYTPNANATGSDTFTYRANDGTATSAAVTVTINITAVNDLPVAVTDQYAVDEDATLNVPVATGVLANDTDADGTALTATVVTSPQRGNLVLNANGSFTYTPSTNFNGSDSFTYRASDGTANTAATTVSITVRPVSDGTAAVRNDEYRVDVNGTLTVTATNGLLSNDEIPVGDTLLAEVVTNVSSGNLTLNTDGSFVYTPTSGFRGDVTFTYKGSNVATTPATATVTIHVDSRPVAVDDSAPEVTEDTPLIVDAANGVLKNDTDADGNTLTASVVTQPTHGTLTLNANGSYQYTPALNYSGPDSFQYRVNDGRSDSATAATVVLTVKAVNDAPVAADNSYTTSEDTVLTVNNATGVLGNDSDVDNAALTATIVTNVQHGSLTLNADGSFNYTPSANYNGPDSFVYRANDGTASSANATVNINVTAVNDAPTAVANTYSTVAGNQLVVAAAQGVLANDTDPESNPLTAIVGATPTRGTLSLSANGGFTYTPESGFTGTDSFTYRANDGTASSEPVTVTIQVTAINEFTVLQNSPAGTTIGNVVANSVPGNERLFQLQNTNLNAALVLQPDDHISGDPSASIVLIEYLDYGCPHCRDAHPIVKQMEQQFAGQLLVVRRHLPIITSTSPHAARAAEAASRQGKFDEMTDLLFEKLSEWRAEANPQARFESYATSLGLNLTQFPADYANAAVAARVNRDRDAGLALGANSTPWFYLNGQQLPNPSGATAFSTAIQNAITASTDLVTIDRRTGLIKVLKPSGLTSAVSPLQLTVNVSNSLGNTQAVPVKITISPPPAPASASLPALPQQSAATDAAFADQESDDAWFGGL